MHNLERALNAIGLRLASDEKRKHQAARGLCHRTDEAKQTTNT